MTLLRVNDDDGHHNKTIRAEAKKRRFAGLCAQKVGWDDYRRNASQRANLMGVDGVCIAVRQGSKLFARLLAFPQLVNGQCFQ